MQVSFRAIVKRPGSLEAFRNRGFGMCSDMDKGAGEDKHAFCITGSLAAARRNCCQLASFRSIRPVKQSAP